MNHLQKNYLECVKTERNNNKFTISKYHINTMKIIKLFRVNIFKLVTNFPHLTIFGKGGHFGSLVSSWGFLKKPTAKIGGFALRKKGREKTWMANRAQKKRWPKRELTFNFKIFKYVKIWMLCLKLLPDFYLLAVSTQNCGSWPGSWLEPWCCSDVMPVVQHLTFSFQ